MHVVAVERRHEQAPDEVVHTPLVFRGASRFLELLPAAFVLLAALLPLGVTVIDIDRHGALLSSPARQLAQAVVKIDIVEEQLAATLRQQRELGAEGAPVATAVEVELLDNVEVVDDAAAQEIPVHFLLVAGPVVDAELDHRVGLGHRIGHPRRGRNGANGVEALRQGPDRHLDRVAAGLPRECLDRWPLLRGGDPRHVHRVVVDRLGVADAVFLVAGHLVKDEVLHQRVLVVHRVRRDVPLQLSSDMMHRAWIGQEFRLPVLRREHFAAIVPRRELLDGRVFIHIDPGPARDGLRRPKRIRVHPVGFLAGSRQGIPEGGEENEGESSCQCWMT